VSRLTSTRWEWQVRHGPIVAVGTGRGTFTGAGLITASRTTGASNVLATNSMAAGSDISDFFTR
jgi:hypothetical protein